MDLAIPKQAERPPHTRFELRPVEDRQASLEKGYYVQKDVEYCIVSPPGGKDEVELECSARLNNLKTQVQNGQVPESWLSIYKDSYKAWKEGIEMPVNGIPILGWPAISPAEQQNLIRINIRTVEDLAAINSEGVARLGMGGMTLKNKAVAHLASITDHGKVTQEVSALKAENEDFKSVIEALNEKVRMLTARLDAESSGSRGSKKANKPTDDEIF